MLTPEQIEDAKKEATKKLLEEETKAVIEAHKAVLKARKAHFFSKKLVFQLPFRLEDWYKPSKKNSCCRNK